MDKKIIKIGHRGAMGYCRGNSIASFEKAVELGCDMIELDVHRLNKELVVSHNTPKKGRDYPLLEDVINLINKKAKMNIELKGRGTAVPVSELIKKYIKKGWKEDYFLISSFYIEELEDFRKQGLGVKIGLLTKKDRFSKDTRFYSIHPSLKITNKKLVDDMHDRGFKVFVWTVNKKRDIDRMISLGVDGIFSDYPDRL